MSTFQEYAESPENKVEGNTLTNRFGDVYRHAKTIKDIRGAAIGHIPIGTDCWVATHTKTTERGYPVLRPVTTSESWEYRLCLGLASMSVYEDEYKFVD